MVFLLMESFIGENTVGLGGFFGVTSPELAQNQHCDYARCRFD